MVMSGVSSAFLTGYHICITKHRMTMNDVFSAFLTGYLQVPIWSSYLYKQVPHGHVWRVLGFLNWLPTGNPLVITFV